MPLSPVLWLRLAGAISLAVSSSLDAAPATLPAPEPDRDEARRFERLARKTRIVLPEVRRAFYRSGGRFLVGRKVYLHVEAKVVQAQPAIRETPSGSFLVFDNQSVPLVIHHRNATWRQVQRNLDGAEVFSVRGTLRIPEDDPRRRVHLFVQSIKRTPGRWK